MNEKTFNKKLEDYLKEEREKTKNKKLINFFLIGGIVCLGMGNICDNKDIPLSTLGYVGAGLCYGTALVYSFKDKIKGYLNKKE